MSLENRSKPELEKLCEEYQIDLPTDIRVTKKIMVSALEELGITEQSLKVLNKKEKEEAFVPEVNIDGQAVVCMERDNPSFGYKSYKFSRDKKYVVMEEDDARELLSTTPGFRRATRDEVVRYYRL
jgi:hypothetical protein